MFGAASWFPGGSTSRSIGEGNPLRWGIRWVGNGHGCERVTARAGPCEEQPDVDRRGGHAAPSPVFME